MTEAIYILDEICLRTDRFIKAMPKELRKEYGQFFTGVHTARFMASMFDIHAASSCDTLKLLDAGAGSGILTAALAERLLNDTQSVICATCYETDQNIIPLLAENLESLKKAHPDRFESEIIRENYILCNDNGESHGLFECTGRKERFDFIIGNPPYKKISADSPEAKAMPHVCHGAPNLYFLFMAMGVSQLNESAEMVYIIPRSWTSGAYFEKFRHYLLTRTTLEHIHLFESRDKVFEKESVLQETMIVKVCNKKEIPSEVLITTTPDSKNFSNPTRIQSPYSAVVAGRREYVFLPTNEKEIENLRRLNNLPYTMPEIGIRMKTGLVVDFRSREYLRQEKAPDTFPLIYCTHIREGHVKFPAGRENEYLATSRKGMLQPNKNYLFIKRFTAKEEPRRLQCGIYLKRNMPDYEYISSQNKVNFVDSDKEMSECAVFGLYVLFNSRPYDLYYRILNGSTQVNSTEINTMPVPPMDTIELMGKELIKTKDFSEESCDRILNAHI
ncbi:MAG: Eco57I restriction-modification methylase domain-containing protein [Bacteroidaceae bacterium]|nr:Eco57I restriction-modification methylase domain-containing protein [Bacteroidaceae bacterium]